MLRDVTKQKGSLLKHEGYFKNLFLQTTDKVIKHEYKKTHSIFVDKITFTVAVNAQTPVYGSIQIYIHS